MPANLQHLWIIILLPAFFAGCESNKPIHPIIITEQTLHDTDDPAIWIHPTDPSQSLVLGTDKNTNGALYVYDLDGKIIADKVIHNLKRPNNVDVGYGLELSGDSTDFAIVTERQENRLRIYKLPGMEPIDNGGLEVFVGESQREPMGVAIYKRPSDNQVFAIVSRKSGPTNGSYLWQYLMNDDGMGNVQLTKVREFGKWSGKKEIEAIAVDAELGHVYYSDETSGIRKYKANPDAANADVELAHFGTTGFKSDHEGISIYKTGPDTGYILVSNQQDNSFHIFKREGSSSNPHQHEFIKKIFLETDLSDGSDVTNVNLGPSFSKGLFVAMSEGKVFHYYSWKDIAGSDL